MTRNLSKLLSLMLAVIMCVGLLPSFAAAEEEIVLDWFVDDTNSAYSYPARGTLVEEAIYAKTGIRVNMTHAANGTHDQLSAMIAGDSLPDIITFGNYSNTPDMLMNQMIEGDYLYSFQELDEIYPGLLAACRPDTLAWWASPDGQTYGYPNSAYSDVDTANNPRAQQPLSPLSMRRDLWEQLGCPDISTPDGFLDACLRAQEEIGQYNGYDIIGFQCWPGVLNSISIIAEYFAVPFEDEDGNYINWWYADRFKEVMAFFNKAYRMGVLHENNFSDQDATVAEHVTQGRVFALITNPSSYGNTGMIPLWKSDNNASYFLPVLRNSDGEDPMLVDATSWGTMPTSVTKFTDNAEACAKLLAFLISDEGQLLLFKGVEGETFYYDENGKCVTTYDGTKAAEYGLNTMFPLRNYNYQASMTPFDRNSYTAGYINKSDMLDYSYSKKAIMRQLPGDDRQAEMSELSSQLNEYANRMYALLITAESEEAFNELYDEMIATLKEMGSDELLAYDNEKFQYAKELMGVEYFWPPYAEKAAAEKAE